MVDRASVLKAGAALTCYTAAGVVTVPYAVSVWWKVTLYSGDVPYWTVVLLERMGFLLAGVVPAGLALVVAALNGRLARIPGVALLSYAVGAGVLWKALPFLIGRVWVHMPRVLDVLELVVIAVLYYLLIVGLARVRTPVDVTRTRVERQSG